MAAESNAHPASHEVWLIRHGETEWSRSGQHTGRTDIGLTARGREQAQALAKPLAAQHFDAVLASPMSRAIETCKLAGLGERVKISADLHEWNYGVYEGRKTADIRQSEPDWSVWHSAIPEGENLAQIEARARGVVDSLLTMLGDGGRIAVFSHAHFLRVLAGCWIGDSAALGAHLYLDTASVSILGFDRENRAIRRWNAKPEGCE
ncbi:putative phosphoglycerate mutase [Paraburkholderia bannensis]|uniref:Putative phosphoglycerate mutase n=1 Tax=Paraburkholderia bannensis TaxID=765414 RepID=A0A7W9WTY2_9BURK|nr:MULTISPECIES: histidine phosphatase family protein [Paraburkholderia]MBB3260875.1 putative phosphoglycerate mutase [Paraburkholderia sp. WP4_3_2]MBB6105780.1 putative phosphoglycerate mutase [Paraburkholderia bannensis]